MAGQLYSMEIGETIIRGEVKVIRNSTNLYSLWHIAFANKQNHIGTILRGKEFSFSGVCANLSVLKTVCDIVEGIQGDDEKTYGVVWSNRELEIAQTGYVFEKFVDAVECGWKGLKWFAENNSQTEIDEIVGTQVDWTAEISEKPIGFYIDTRQGDNNKWFDINGVLVEEKPDCKHPNAVLSDANEPATYHCPDCGENFIAK